MSSHLIWPYVVVQSLCERSTILEGNIEHVKQLVEWVEDKKFRWKLCYRATRDGWKAGDFHRKCGDVEPTLILVKCGTNVFGGFAAWSKLEIPIRYTSAPSFMHSCHEYTKCLFRGITWVNTLAEHRMWSRENCKVVGGCKAYKVWAWVLNLDAYCVKGFYKIFIWSYIKWCIVGYRIFGKVSISILD